MIAALLVPLAGAAIAGLVMFWPANAHPVQPVAVQGQRTVSGVVTDAQSVSCGSVGAGGSGAGGTDTECTQLSIRVTSGPTTGTVVKQLLGQDPTTPKYSPGDSLSLAYSASAPAESQYSIRDFERGPPLASIAIAFAIFIVVVGRWRGFAAIAALGVSFLLLIKFMLPAILNGKNAVEVAAVAATVILFIALYSTHGLSVRTSVAVLGTGVSLALIGVLGSVSIGLAHITGLGTDEAQYVAGEFHQVNVHGLLLAGVIIGALGVLDDVTITQVSSVWELHQADPGLGLTDLYRAGMRIGRDHIGSTVNTLVLAYAGASLPLLVLASTSGQGWSAAASSELVAEEIVRTLIGSIGLAAAVPITTALAAAIAVSEGSRSGVPELSSYESSYEEPRRLAPRTRREASVDPQDYDPPTTETRRFAPRPRRESTAGYVDQDPSAGARGPVPRSQRDAATDYSDYAAPGSAGRPLPRTERDATDGYPNHDLRYPAAPPRPRREVPDPYLDQNLPGGNRPGGTWPPQDSATGYLE